MASSSLVAAAGRLAELLLGGASLLSDSGRGDLVFDAEPEPRLLTRGEAPSEVWAVDGGQGLVADARCLALLVTRASRVRFCAGECVLEDEGELQHWVDDRGGETRAGLLAAGIPIAPDAGMEGAVNLLREAGEWDAVRRCIAEAEPGALVLVDGDLVADWRLPASYVAGVLAEAEDAGATVAGVTKHSSLSRGGAPLVGWLEREADLELGPRTTWWAPIAHTRPGLGAALQVVVARLDPDSPYAFRIDLPAAADPEPVLAAISAVSCDAAFPGYPYPLTVADRLAACPGWLRDEVRFELEELFERAGVPADVRERAFADRHRLMERA